MTQLVEGMQVLPKVPLNAMVDSELINVFAGGHGGYRIAIGAQIIDAAGGDGTSTVKIRPRAVIRPEDKGVTGKFSSIRIVILTDTGNGNDNIDVVTGAAPADATKIYRLIHAVSADLTLGPLVYFAVQQSGTAYTGGDLYLYAWVW